MGLKVLFKIAKDRSGIPFNDSKYSKNGLHVCITDSTKINRPGHNIHMY